MRHSPILVFLLAVSGALAGPFGGSNSPFGSSGGGPASAIVDGTIVAADFAAGAAANHTTAGVIKARTARIAFAPSNAAYTWTNLPAATTELLGSTLHRQIGDLTGYTSCRVQATPSTVLCFAGTVIAVQYSSDGGTNWKFLDDGTSAAGDHGAHTPQIQCDTTTVMPRSSAFMTLTTDAAADRMWRIVGDNGDGVVDPNFVGFALECY
jgi:hypothetical protein